MDADERTCHVGPFVLNVKKRDADGVGGPFRNDGNVLNVLNILN